MKKSSIAEFHCRFLNGSFLRSDNLNLSRNPRPTGESDPIRFDSNSHRITCGFRIGLHGPFTNNELTGREETYMHKTVTGTPNHRPRNGRQHTLADWAAGRQGDH